MKIKKSELLALIKEEIMDEMRGLTMMDDPYDDDAVPAGMEPGGAMDQVAKEIDHMITIEMDDVISIMAETKLPISRPKVQFNMRSVLTTLHGFFLVGEKKSCWNNQVSKRRNKTKSLFSIS